MRKRNQKAIAHGRGMVANIAAVLIVFGMIALTACASSITPIGSTPEPIPEPAPSSVGDPPQGSPTDSTFGQAPALPTRGEPREDEAEAPSASNTAPPQPTKAAPPSTATTASSAWRTARAAIDSMLDQPFFRTSTWGALVVNTKGDTLYSRNAGKLLIPASNVKLVTAATALTQLGPDFVLRPNTLSLALRDTVPADFGPMYDTVWLKNRPLKDVLPTMLKQSHNRLAEQIFKTVGLEKTRSARRDSSIVVTQRQLAAWQIPVDGFIIYDGSGYDRANYLSAETIVRILTVMRENAAFVNALPVAGVDGTLVRRMRATSATGNALAKTGSLFSIRSLSGYLTTASGDVLMFSLICNAYTTPGTVVTATMDSVVTRLADLSDRH